MTSTLPDSAPLALDQEMLVHAEEPRVDALRLFGPLPVQARDLRLEF